VSPQDALSLKFAIEEPWHKEYGTFLMIPALSTLACCFIPVFHCEQGLTYLAMAPLTGAFSYGHTLSPRKPYYEKWQKLMDYPAFVLASVKKNLSFAVPAGVLAWVVSMFLSGYPKELAMFFEAAVWGLSAGICLYALIAYAEETFKLRKIGGEGYRIKLANLWRWIVPPVIAFSLLVVAKSYVLLDIIRGRP
jgi:hypothetical protein